MFLELLGKVARVADEEHLAKLYEGVTAWNLWRMEHWNENLRPNLNGANLQGVNLSGVIFDFVDLTHANLSDAILISARFLGADLSHAKLNRTRCKGAYFSDAILTKADLSNASFFSADFSRADLTGACLEDANLGAIRAVDTNFCDSKLTGACIQDWSINNATQLNNVICKYVYLDKGNWSKQERRYLLADRRPSDPKTTFAPGEFTKLFQKALETVDLIFSDGIDWKAFFQSFQELRSQYDDDDISIQAIEKKSGGAFVIRLEVPPGATKAAIERQAKALYERGRQVLEVKYQSQLQVKDAQLALYQEWLKAERRDNTDLMGIVKIMADKETSKVIQNFNASIIGGVAGNIEGNQIIYSPEQRQTLSESAAEIQKLLDQLSQTYPTDTKAGQMKLATEAIAQIEDNPDLVQRVLSAGKAGGVAALEQFLNHPAASFVIAAMEDWQQTKGS
jgi:uncharacterized protein YjbI with pentapeptide repeats